MDLADIARNTRERAVDPLDRLHRDHDLALRRGQLVARTLGFLLGTHRQRGNEIGHDREAATCVAGTARLGGLLDLRDRALPDFTEKLGVLFTGLSQTLNAASNAATTVPAPAQLLGRQSGLVGSDRLGFTGSAVFAVTSGKGALVASTTIDFSALGPPTGSARGGRSRASSS
jgi:hypothetical protein